MRKYGLERSALFGYWGLNSLLQARSLWAHNYNDLMARTTTMKDAS